jgi:hypothetical protein
MLSSENRIPQFEGQDAFGDQASLPYARRSSHSHTTDTNALNLRFSRAVDLYLYRHPRLHMLGLETRSFLHRIGIVLSNSESHRVPTGFSWAASPPESSPLDTRAYGRIEHIRKLCSIHPWATPIDWKTHLDSWDQGVEWAAHSHGRVTSSEGKAAMESELTYIGSHTS